MSRDEQRPYPDGIAWDEAYRQRKRADAAEESRDKLAEIVRRFLVHSNRVAGRGEPITDIFDDAANLFDEMGWPQSEE